MKRIVHNTTQLASLAILLTAVSALMFSAIPGAMAMPDPTVGGNPSPSVKNTIITLEVGSSPVSEVNELIVYDTATDPDDDDTCGLPIPAGIKAWRLVSAGDGITPIRMAIPAGIANGLVEMPFGTSVAASFDVDATDGAELTADGSSPTGSGITQVQGTWLSVGTVAGLPSTDRVGFYQVGVCGEEEAGLVFDYQGTSPFAIALPVGGEVIPIAATSLVLAGISSSALWIVPLVAIAGASFAVLKFQVSRKED